jgi:hypothetical protein
MGGVQGKRKHERKGNQVDREEESVMPAAQAATPYLIMPVTAVALLPIEATEGLFRHFSLPCASY